TKLIGGLVKAAICVLDAGGQVRHVIDNPAKRQKRGRLRPGLFLEAHQAVLKSSPLLAAPIAIEVTGRAESHEYLATSEGGLEFVVPVRAEFEGLETEKSDLC